MRSELAETAFVPHCFSMAQSQRKATSKPKVVELEEQEETVQEEPKGRKMKLQPFYLAENNKKCRSSFVMNGIYLIFVVERRMVFHCFTRI